MFGTPKSLLRRYLEVQTPTHQVFGCLGTVSGYNQNALQTIDLLNSFLMFQVNESVELQIQVLSNRLCSHCLEEIGRSVCVCVFFFLFLSEFVSLFVVRFLTICFVSVVQCCLYVPVCVFILHLSGMPYSWWSCKFRFDLRKFIYSDWSCTFLSLSSRPYVKHWVGLDRKVIQSHRKSPTCALKTSQLHM